LTSQQSPRLGKYELIAEIAHGGMGIVYLAHAGSVEGFNKLVVIKELKPELAGEETFREMFLDEARLAARLNHRNIVQTNEVGTSDGRYFIAMDYLEGAALNQVMRLFAKTQPVAQETQLRIFAETLAGLHYAHELTDFDRTSLGIVHRDVCPQNVFITFDGQVKIVDFGVAKARNRLHETQAGTLKGRVSYMSPEHIGGTGIDRRADVFSVGVMLWELVARRRIWGKRSELEILKALVERKIPALPDDVETTPELREIVNRATASTPADRFATAHELRHALEQLLMKNAGGESLAELGARLSNAMSAERERMQSVVETHVARQRRASLSPDASLPKLDLDGPPESEHSLPSISKPSISSPSISSPSISAPSSVSTMTPQVKVTADVEATRTDEKKRTPVYAAAAIVVVAVVAVTYAIASRGSAQHGSEQASLASAPPTIAVTTPLPASATAATPDLIELAITAIPQSATIAIDGTPMLGNPYTGQFARGTHHRVTISASGYTTKSQDIDLTATTHATVSLEHVSAFPPPQTVQPVAAPVRPVAMVQQAPAATPPPATTATPGPLPGSTPTIAPEIDPKGGSAPKQKIDPHNPYGEHK
jgi:serine/threonine-protein kinase